MASSKDPRDLRIGILGGGQLARFISLKAQEMGVKVRLLCSSMEEPAAQVTRDVILGDLNDPEARRKFLEEVDVVTFESEFIDASHLSNLALQSFKVFPSVELMNQIRDRFTQKELLGRFSIPTALSIPFENRAQLLSWYELHRQGFVLKKRLFGYDGYGTLVVNAKKDLEKIPQDISPDEWIAEEFCAFKKELAFSLARNSSNRFYLLPLVETKQTRSKCDWVKGPVRLKSHSPLVGKFKKMMTKIDYVGLLSVELFQTSRGLIVNELAPRVHNSAHYSIEALQVSQFEAHLRAILNWPFPKSPRLYTGGFAMANMIGTVRQLNAEPMGFTHWYGKSEMKPGRKMGHLTVLSGSADKALTEVLHWRKKFGSETA